jgi:hypothetical protein
MQACGPSKSEQAVPPALLTCSTRPSTTATSNAATHGNKLVVAETTMLSAGTPDEALEKGTGYNMKSPGMLLHAFPVAGCQPQTPYNNQLAVKQYKPAEHDLLCGELHRRPPKLIL